MTEHSQEPLLLSTLQTAARADARIRATVPCLTLACHPDSRRIGERALLTPLLVRKPVLLSRVDTEFALPGSSSSRPLADPYLSRNPLRIVAGPAPGSIALEGLSSKVAIDGELIAEGHVLPAHAIEAGVVLQLSSRIVLLLHAASGDQPTEVEGLLGHSDGIEGVRKRLRHVAPLDIPVLIVGETGVGKECVAQAVHAQSVRAEKPFVAVNMATLTDHTASAALFGHARGAFTGALARHRGFFERASHGTLFLDEVADTPAEVQAMLLRTLETGRVQPMGDERDRGVDVRVVAATDGDLDDGVTTGSFRGALKHRLAGYEIHVPPLRRRPDDIPRLLVYFLGEELHTLGRASALEHEAHSAQPPLAGELVARLLTYPFPGNVRELRNVARQLALELITTGHVALTPELDARLTPKPAGCTAPTKAPAMPAAATVHAPTARRPERATHDLGEDALLAALEEHGWSPHRAAAALGIATSTIHYLLRKAGIRRATDLDDAELIAASERCGADLHEMARALKVSPRALRLTLTRRRLG